MLQGGTGIMEMLAHNMKAAGTFISRSISYEGVEYDTVRHNLTDQERETYDAMADLWSELLKAMDDAAKNANMGRNARQNYIQQFYNTQQRFFLQLMMAFQTKTAIKSAEKDIENGESVVISLYNTGEASTERGVKDAIASGSNIDYIEFSSKDAMVEMIRKYFPIHQYQEYTDKDGKTQTRQVVDPTTGDPLINKENLDAQNKLIEKVVSVSLPENPLDQVINHFGKDRVAEITGRKKRLVVNESGRKVYEARATKEISQKKVNQHEMSSFMDGKKRIAVISGAASTGFDLHASKKAKNQQRRNFYALQLSWSADVTMQSFGRVHRTEQANAPVIKLVETDVASQKRLVNTTQSRLASLGAISKGERETLSTGLFRVEDITDQYGEAALATIMSETHRVDLERMGLLDKNQQPKDVDVDGWLNRIMVLPVAEQNNYFEKFYKYYQENVERAKADGKYDVGVEKIRGKNPKVIGKPEVLHKDKESGVETRLVTVESLVKVHKESFDDRIQKIRRPIPVKNKTSGRAYLVDQREDGDIFVYSPRGHYRTVHPEERAAFVEKHERMTEDEARKVWMDEYSKIPAEEAEQTTIVTGSIFPVYDKIFFTERQSRKVKRVVFEDGTSLVGMELQKSLVPKVKQNFGIGAELATATPREIYDLIMGDSIIELDNGWQISRKTVMQEKRIELDVKANPPASTMLKKHGVFTEQIRFSNRHFIPSEEEKAIEVIGSIIGMHKPIRDLAARDLSAIITYTTEQLDAAQITPKPESVTGQDVVKHTKKAGRSASEMLSYAAVAEKTDKHISWSPDGKNRDLNFLSFKEKMMYEWKDISFPIKKIQDIVQEAGIKIQDAVNIDYAIDQLRGIAGTVADYLEKNLRTIFDAFPKKIRGQVYAETSKYLIAKRTVDLYQDEKKQYHDAGYDLATAEKMVEFVETGAHPLSAEILQAAPKIWAIGQEMRNVKLENGIIDDSLYESLIEEHYVPFYRDLETKKGGPVTGAKDRFTSTSKGIYKIRGSETGAPIIDPIQNLIRHVSETYENAARARITNLIIDLRTKYPDALEGLIEKVEDKWLYAGTIEHRQEIDAILRPAIIDICKRMGVNIEMKVKLAARQGGRLQKVLGLFDRNNNKIQLMVGSTEGAMSHEMGHAIHRNSKYTQFLDGLAVKHTEEMNRVADTRYQGADVDAKFVAYVRSQPEKIAEFISMYVNDRVNLQNIAPAAYAEFEEWVAGQDVLKDLITMHPTSVKGMMVENVKNFVRDRSIPKDEDVVSVVRGGKIVSYRVPQEVAFAIKNMNPEMFPGWMKVLLIPNRVFRATAIGLNIDFVIPNVARDQMDAAFNTNTIPVFDFFMGVKSYLTKDRWYQIYRQRGGFMESLEAGITGAQVTAEKIQYGGDLQKVLDPYYWQQVGVLKGLTQTTWYIMKFPFQGLMELANISEMGTRLGVFRRTQVGFPKGVEWYGKKMSVEAGVHAARTSTLDFQNMGRSMKTVNEIRPFTNAALEGMYRMYSTIKNHPKRALLKFMAFGVLPMVGLYLWNRQNRAYKAVPEKDKEINWIIMKSLDSTEYWKIPKGHIVKFLVNPIQMAWEIADGQIMANPLETIGSVALDLSTLDPSSLVPVPIRLIVDPITNYDLYWKKAIEPPAIAAIFPPGMRWTESTSEALKAIGKALNISPVMLQHELVLLGSGLARNIIWATDVLSGEATERQVELMHMPVTRRFSGKLNDWNTDIDNNIRDINKTLSTMGDYSPSKLYRSYGHKYKDIAAASKATNEYRSKLLRKRNELYKAKYEINKLLREAER